MITLSDQIKYQGWGYIDPKVAVGNGQAYGTIQQLIDELSPLGQIANNMRVFDLEGNKIYRIYYEDNTWKYVEVISTLTAKEIAILLNTLSTLSDQVWGDRVRYDETLTVNMKINSMESDRQRKIQLQRLTFESQANINAFTITGLVNVLQIVVNHNYVASGRLAAAYDGLDYRYAHVDGSTVVNMNPVSIVLKTGDYLDLMFY